MSRTYALALIFAAVTLIGGLFYGQYRYLTGGQKEVAGYAAEVHERVIEGQLEEMERRAMEVEDRLEEDSKYRFRPILSFLNNAFERRDAYLDRVEENKENPDSDLAAFWHFHDAELDSLVTAYTTFLRKFGRDMDLRLEDINAKVTHVGKNIDEVRFESGGTMPFTSGKSLTQELLTLDYLEVVGRVVQDVIDLSGGKVISCFFWPEFFPVVSTRFLNPRLGETIYTRLSVGNYATELDPEDVTIIIDGDSLQPNSAGFIDYDFMARNRGRQVLEIQLLTRSRLTGEVKQQGVTEYSYFVR